MDHSNTCEQFYMIANPKTRDWDAQGNHNIPVFKDKYIITPMTELDPIPKDTYVYECTITFDHKYMSYDHVKKVATWQSVELVLNELNKGMIGYELHYSVEYQEKGTPHVHLQIFSTEIETKLQKKIQGRLNKSYGRTKWYQCEKTNYFHKISQMVWSDYIRKDIVKNSERGLIHGYIVRLN